SVAKPQLLEKPDVFATKIKAASDTKSNSDFIIIARIESLIAGTGISDAIARANLYQQAGADAIVIHSKKKDPGEIIQFLKLWNDRLPVVIIPTAYPSITLTEAKLYSVTGVIFANQILRAAIKSINNYLAELITAESLSECTQSISSVQEIFDLQRMEEYKAEQDKYEKLQDSFLLYKTELKEIIS
ncbi:MAG: isocitrate lyase/phosphoenolpyruvate mutase family protein, partial [Bacillota bacterium]